MALVGEAHIIVRAITTGVERDIRNGFRNVDRAGGDAGTKLGTSFSRGFNSSGVDKAVSRIGLAFRGLDKEGEAASRGFSSLIRTGNFAATAIAGLVGGISSAIGGIVSLGGAAVGAASSLIVLANSGFALAAGMIAAKLALGGVGKALSALNKSGGGGGGSNAAALAAAQAAANARVEDAERSLAQVIERNRESLIDANNDVRDAQLDLNKALEEGREQIQQLGFDAEDAALDEKKAAIELNKARETLARVQDLPPNSRARQEAELAYQQADLNLRKAKDRSSDLNAEQDRLARTGVRGTDVVINATERLADAEANKNKTIRDGLRSQEDALRALTAAQLAANDAMNDAGGGGGSNPYEGLNQAQIDFVNFLQAEVLPLIKTLKETAANAFLPLLTDAIRLVASGAFETINTGIGEVARSMGLASISIAQAIVDATNLKNLASVFTSSGRLIESLGRSAGSFYGIALSLLSAAAPMAERFALSVEGSLGKFDAYLKSAEGNRALLDFFARAEAAAAQFGRIFGNLFAGFGAIINANLGEGTGGQLLLDWLETTTDGFAALDDTVEGAAGLKAFFLDVATNARSVLGAVGELIQALFTLSANPAIGETFDILKAGVPALSAILTASVEAAPALANLIVTITEIFALLADSESTKVFFNTLNAAATVIRDIFANEVVQDILKVLGPITAFASAIGLMTILATTAGSIVLGFISRLVGGVQSLIAAFTFLTTGVLGPVLLVIGALAAAFIYLYNTNEDFAASINEAVAPLLPLFSDLASTVMGAIQPLIPILITLAQTVLTSLAPVLITLVTLVAGIITQITPFLGTLFTLFATTVGQIIAAITPLIPVLLGAFNSILTAVIPLVTTLLSGLIPAFTAILDAVLPLIPVLIETLVPVITAVIEAIVPLVTMLIEALAPAFMQIMEVVTPLISLIFDTLIPIIVGLIEAFAPLVIQLVEALMPAITGIIEALLPLLPVIIDLVTQGIQFLIPILDALAQIFMLVVMPAIQTVIDIIGHVLTPIIESIGQILGGVVNVISGIMTGDWDRVWKGIQDIVRGNVNLVIGIVEGLVNGVIDLINGMIRQINGVVGAVSGALGLGGSISIGTLGYVSIPRMAKGGVVFPSNGGSIVNVAEAGRPERIEPLDEDGLSKRDKAMIDRLSGGGAAGATINIYTTEGQSPQEIAAMVSREIAFMMRKGAIS